MRQSPRIHIVVAAISACWLLYVGASGARPASPAAGPITMRLIPAVTRAAVGDPLLIHLEFTNTSPSPVRLWMAPAGRMVGWDLLLTASGPWMGRRVLVPSILYQALYLPADSDMIVLRHGERASAVLALRGGKHLPDRVGSRLYAIWDCYTPDEYATALRTGAWPHRDAGECLSRPGVYEVSAELDFSSATVGFTGPRGGPSTFAGRLKASPVRLVLTGKSH